MNIVFATTAFPRSSTDTHGAFVFNQARALVRLGHTVSVVAMHAPGAATEETFQGIRVLRPKYLPERWEVFRNESGGIPVVWKRSKAARLTLLPFLLRQAAAIAKTAAAAHADIVHAHWTLSGMSALAAQPVYRRPVVLTVHGSDMFQGAKVPGVKQLTGGVLRGASQVIAISGALRETCLAAGVPASRVSLIPESIDMQHFSPGAAERDFIVLFAGSLIERKGVNYFLDAAVRVRARHPDSTFVVVGDGELRPALETHARAIGIGQQVEFTGPLSQDDVRTRMQHARVFVLPSLEEGLGVVLIEAMACGTPCVGTRVGGIPDVIASGTGRLCRPADPDDLADQICAVASDAQTWARYSAAARAHATANYDDLAVARRMIEVYERACGGHS